MLRAIVTRRAERIRALLDRGALDGARVPLRDVLRHHPVGTSAR